MNYRPVANLKYLGKTIERVVSSRISDHVRANNLSDTFQSAYKPFHGTETAVLRVNDDILSAKGWWKNHYYVGLLDLSAAFDIVDQKILLSRLQYHLGIHDIALDWCKSYLLNRPQHVCIGNAITKPVILNYSVPPRLCARPTVVYCLYLSGSWYNTIQKICSAHISTLLGAQGANPETPGQAPLLFHDKCPGFFYVHYTTHGTYTFTSHPKDEAIMVKCLAQGHKRRDRPGRDSNPHSDNARTWVQ